MNKLQSRFLYSQNRNWLSSIILQPKYFSTNVFKLVLLIQIVLFAYNPTAIGQGCSVSCGPGQPVGNSNHTISFAGVEYDYANCSTCFYYCITNGPGNAISHTVFGEVGCENTCLDDPGNVFGTWTQDLNCTITQSVGNGMPQQGNDPTTNICGVKFDEGISSTAMYFICVDGIQTQANGGIGNIQFGIKAGPNNFITTITGPTACSDECPPNLVCPAPLTIECTDNINDLSLTGEAVNLSNCDATITYSDQSDNNTCPETVTRTWTATPICGNRMPVSCTQIITIDDTQAPVISTSDVSGDKGCGDPGTPSFSGADNCDGPFSPNVDDGGGPTITGCSYEQTWTATYTDACGNPAAPVSITWTWSIDNEDPVISTSDVSGDKGCGDPGTPSFSGADNCDGPFSPNVDDGGGPTITGCSYEQTWTATYTDACGNPAAPVSITWTWSIDNEDPVISTSDVSGDKGCGDPGTPSFSGADNCDGPFSPNVDDGGGPTITGCSYEQTWTATYTDACGNPAAPVSITWTWSIDNEDPVISTSDVSGDKGCGDPGTPSFSGADNCDGPFSPNVDDGGGPTITGCSYEQTWTATYTDACGNPAAPVSITWTWSIDNEDPVISTSDVSGDKGCGDPGTPSFSGADNCDGPFSPNVDDGGGPTITGCSYEQTWTATYTDACGNPAAPVSITWTWSIDNEDPVISTSDVSGDKGCGDPGTPSFSGADNCDGPFSPNVDDGGGPTITGCSYEQTWTATYTDACGNPAAPVSITWTWSIDNEDPVISTSDVSGDKGCGDPGTPSFSGADNCDGPFSPNVDDGGGPTITGCSYEQTWTATYTDACGNPAAPVSITWTWSIDNEDPVISTSDVSGDKGCGDPGTPSFSGADNCDGPFSPNVDDGGGPTITGCSYEQTWTATYTDACGNPAAPVSITWTWSIDNEDPVISTSDVSGDKGCGDPGTPSFSGADNCDGPFSPNVDDGGGPTITGCSYEQTWTATYTDACGNPAAPVSITWTWSIDNEDPVISTSDVSGDKGCGDPGTPSFSGADNCDGPFSPNVDDGGGPTITGCSYEQTWTATYTDACGNPAAPVSITWTWSIDNEDPVISTSDVSGDKGCGDPGTPSFSGADNCDGPFSPNVDDGGGPTITGCSYEQTWTATYTDACGNPAAPVSITWTWSIDNEDPVISTSDVSGDKGCGDPGTPSFSGADNCDGPFSPNVDDGGGPTITGCSYEQTWTATYTDACGNPAAPVSITWTWSIDNEDPVISTSDVSGDKGCGDPGTPSFSGADNCDGPFSPNVDDGGGPTITGCSYEQTWTATYTDACGNPAAPVSITWTWSIDNEDPVISTSDVSGDKGCGDPGTPSFSGADNCDGPFSPNVDDGGGPTITGCSYEQTWTATYTDACGNPAAPVSITWNLVHR